MLACLCCKKGGIGFKEFENAEGDEYAADLAQGSPATAAQNGPDVYVLPLTEVSLPMAKQPGRSVQLLKSTDLGRHSLLYLKEIGHGWFGKVFLGEVNSGVSSAQVVVKELQASASVQEQMQFLEEVQPYRALKHSNLLQCLAQCAEVTPYLLVMEFCPLGDLKGYLRSCRVAESMAPDPLTLQRMACEVACGVLHLHRNNYVHRAKDADWGVAAFCSPFFEDPLGTSPLGSSGAPPLPLTGEEELEVGARAAAQRGHWRSNVSANNNSGSRCPESWDPSSVGYHADGCCSPKQTPRASPEPAYPGESLLGLQAASSAQEPGCCPGLPNLCPAQGLAPAPCLVTPSWTEAPGSGGDHLQAEPKLATEAEGTAGPCLSLPSVPSPSQEGAPLPSEEASAPDAPDALPDSPTPAAGGEVSATKPASTLNGGGSSPEVEVPSSEDEDTAEATSGIFTDTSSDGLQAERPDVVPAFRSLQKQVGTPDSLDSLDIPSSASDGGYEVFSPSAAGPSGGQPRALDSGYDTENYESPEFVLKESQEGCEPQAFGELTSEGEGPGPEMRLSASLSGLNEKNPYRDSAYFSDLETEAEPTSGPEKCGGDQAPGPELGLPSTGQSSAQASLRPGVPGEAQGSGPGEVLPPSLRLEGSSPDPSTCPSGLVPEPPEPQGPAEVPPGPSPSCSQFFLLTPVPLSSEGNSSELQGPTGLLSGLTPQKRMAGPGTPRAPLRLALPGLPAALEGRPEEEEEDSEDSDESDEELRCYSVQEPSEDSEEEAPAVPVVVAESQSARNLRSLLKMPSLLSEAFCEDLERKKKAVSFFDDVTVYLFDQESPTRELGEPFPGAKESPPTFLMRSPSSPSAPSPPRQADGSPDGSTAKEGGGFAWDDDFPLMQAKAAFAMALDPSLGVTIWELFELGTQPYPQHSDQQVLAYAVREQQLKLPKPQLQLTLSDRWYEVMQFCWLQPEQRPTAEEVHLLLSYLCAKGATEAEEEFERRWRSLRPGGGGVGPGPGAAGPTLGGVVELAAASSFPLLEQFAGDGFHADGDDVLTVTETSRGLNFEYKWEAGRGAEAFPATLSPDPVSYTHLDVYKRQALGYEVMQFCWLQPEQRPTAEEVHLLLSYLCAKGATEAEEEFERRWRSLRPGGGAGEAWTGQVLAKDPCAGLPDLAHPTDPDPAPAPDPACSDLALRNCLLTADLTVKIGDYGLAHCKYREDYFVTADQLWVPLRWIAPELVDEVHSNLLVVDQTKSGNVW
ncbi:PREDICTED: serine/threonine-protein kinase LMTK1 [Mandrillus leucophaeus]|uniref:serine/threonine-protein kinase LMTK1 n=1 Tax=Mandrillus leucophaeus TaxID=9568 RepID=UPI0005F44B9C|nr:PREDICTED: serine/threonine-protein kinase LMTK1 [Mandrillus leucophaeus]